MVLPLAGGVGDVGVLLVPGEEAGEGEGAVRAGAAREQEELGAAGPEQQARAAEVEEQPAAQEALRVVGEQRALPHELHTPLHLELRVLPGSAAAVQPGFDG